MEPRPPNSRSFNVLVVEDEFLLAMELRDLLRDGGYEVIGPVASIEEALATLDRQLPNACVLDVNLRGRNSAPVARMLKEKGVPFVLSSAYAQDTLDQYAAFSGIANLGKPVPPKMLLLALGALLEI